MDIRLLAGVGVLVRLCRFIRVDYHIPMENDPKLLDAELTRVPEPRMKKAKVDTAFGILHIHRGNDPSFARSSLYMVDGPLASGGRGRPFDGARISRRLPCVQEEFVYGCNDCSGH